MMSPLTFRRVLTGLVFAAVSTLALQAEPAIIAKARAYLGPEDLLNAVKSVHYTGTMLRPNPADPAKPFSLAIDIIFQLPDQQRSILRAPTTVDTIALNAYDGWHRTQDVKNPARRNLQVLKTDQIRRQRFLVQENLGFYRGVNLTGGKIVDQGMTALDGVACRKIAFIHAADIIFYRYFDEATGRLLLTETETGSTVREEGEIRAGGIRFPKKVINAGKDVAGKIQTVTIVFDSITVNETFPESTFENPVFAEK